MKTKLSIPIETIYLLPTDREYSAAEAIIQIIHDIETQSEWSILNYSKQFTWSRTKVENFLQKKTNGLSLKDKLERHRKITNSAPLRSIESRKKAFGLALVPYVEKYGKKNIRQFFDYWTESSGKELRFEAQKFFDIPRRLSTADKLIFSKNGNIDSIQQEADSFLKYMKQDGGYYRSDDKQQYLINWINRSNKSKEVKEYCLQKIT